MLAIILAFTEPAATCRRRPSSPAAGSNGKPMTGPRSAGQRQGRPDDGVRPHRHRRARTHWEWMPIETDISGNPVFHASPKGAPIASFPAVRATGMEIE